VDFFVSNLNFIKNNDKELYEIIDNVIKNYQLDENKFNFYKEKFDKILNYIKKENNLLKDEVLFKNYDFKNLKFFIIIDEVTFLFYLLNYKKFEEKHIIFINDTLIFFIYLIKNFSFSNIDLKKVFFIFSFSKDNQIENYINFFLSLEIDSNNFFSIIDIFSIIFEKEKLKTLLNCFFSKNDLLEKNIEKIINNFLEIIYLKQIINSEILFNIYKDKIEFKNSFYIRFLILNELLNRFIIKISDKETYNKLIFNQIYNILKNIKSLKYTFCDFPKIPPYSFAFVFGAGYNASKINIEKIKLFQKKGIGIIVVDTIYKYFIKNGIIPDFVIILDSQYLNFYDFINIPKRLFEIEENRSIFIYDISSNYKIIEKYEDYENIAFSSVLKDVNRSWVAPNPIAYDFILKTSIKKLPSYGNVSLLAISFGLIFFEKLFVLGFDSSFENYIYHIKDTLDYYYYLYRSNYKDNLYNNLTKYSLRKRIGQKNKSSYELIKNKNIFEIEFSKFKNRICDNFNEMENFIQSFIKNEEIKFNKFNKNEFKKNYFFDIEEKTKKYFESFLNEKYSIIENFFNNSNKFLESDNLKLKNEVFSKDLLIKIFQSIFYFYKDKKEFVNLNKKDLRLVKKILTINK